MGGISLLFRRRRRTSSQFRLRPPGALDEEAFLSTCARCFKCGNACPNSCIHFAGLEGGLEEAFTPYIVARERACILCGACADVCPTGALTPFEATREGWCDVVWRTSGKQTHGAIAGEPPTSVPLLVGR